MKNDIILLDHGSGGELSSQLVSDIFLSRFSDGAGAACDSAVIRTPGALCAMTTDSFVIDPVFFPGGNIGKLAVCGTVNDLAVSGAVPEYLSAGFIIEEGFPLAELESIAESMASEARQAGVRVVCGDTKVVEKGSCDKLFINTTGVGFISQERAAIGEARFAGHGDVIIINGHAGDHGTAILCERQGFATRPKLESDCCCLNNLVEDVFAAGVDIHFMRDATRGGLATVLCELADISGAKIILEEKAVPVRDQVRGACSMLGIDPFFAANEGKLVLVCPRKDADKVLAAMRKHPAGQDAAVIGAVETDGKPGAVVKTHIGGTRVLSKLTGVQLPRIC